MKINLFSGPGSGKTVTSCFLYDELSRLGYSIELTREFVKYWAYQGRKCQSFDQLFIFGNQVHAEDFYFQHGVEHIVSDSPLMLQVAYCKKDHSAIWEDLFNLTKKINQNIKQCNIFLDRSNIPYQTAGRYQNFEEALTMDRFLLDFLSEHIPFKVIDALDRVSILSYVLECLNDAKRQGNR